MSDGTNNRRRASSEEWQVAEGYNADNDSDLVNDEHDSSAQNVRGCSRATLRWDLGVGGGD